MDTSTSQLDRIEAKLDRLESQLADLPGLAAAAGDTFDDLVDRLPGGAAELDRRLRRAAQLGLAISEPDVLEHMERSVAIVSSVARGLQKKTALVAPAQRIGIFALFRILREPEIQRTLAFMVECSRHFGTRTDGGDS